MKLDLIWWTLHIYLANKRKVREEAEAISEVSKMEIESFEMIKKEVRERRVDAEKRSWPVAPCPVCGRALVNSELNRPLEWFCRNGCTKEDGSKYWNIRELSLSSAEAHRRRMNVKMICPLWDDPCDTEGCSGTPDEFIQGGSRCMDFLVTVSESEKEAWLEIVRG